MNLLMWMLQFAFGCHHKRLSRVFTIKKRTYQVCVECGQEFEHAAAPGSSLPREINVAA